jgi:uncharacterized repeat protein (TIGR01451 family)
MKMKHTIFHMKSGKHTGRIGCGVQKETRSAFMRKDLLAIGLGMILSSVTVFSSLAAGGTVTLKDHVPNVVKEGKAQIRSHMSGDTTLNLSLGLPLRNRAELSNLLNQIYDPKSLNFHQFLTSQQFTEHFGPTEDDYQAVIEFARKNGFKVTRTHANRMLLNVSGRAADVEKTFGVALNEYQDPSEARQFFAPDREPSVAGGVKIQDIGGLENYRRPHSHLVATPLGTISGPAQQSGAKAKSNAANANAGSGPFSLYMGNDFRNAYVPGTTLNGSGQNVALVQFDGYFASDIIAYETLTGRPNVPLQNILIDGFSGLPTSNNGGGELEVSLDIEMVLSMAPSVSKILLYEGNPFNFFPNDVLNQIAVDDSARQVSSSWGWNGGPDLTTDQIFQQMAAQGQTYFNASGDSDAFLPGQVDDPIFIGQPSSSPFITLVGGTTLTMNGNGSTYSSETVWNSGGGLGSSGGVSSFYGIPTWQTNINMTPRGGSNNRRNIPDVAMTGDNVLVIADAGIQYSVVGTSCAAPLWGGFTALANQQASLNGRPSVGFINPALYSLASSPVNYAGDFNDTTTGNNTSPQSPNAFNAFPGYDLCTGLGSPKSANLINDLISFNAPVIHISPPPPPYGSTMANVNGSNPNGAWMLFVQDDAPISSGMIGNGWMLNLTTADLVGTAGDIQLLMSASTPTVFSGQTATFVLSVTNYGPSASTNVVVTDALPLNATIVATNATQGTFIQAGSSLIWNVGNLALNDGAAMTLTVKLHSNGTFENSANVDTGTPDPNPDDDLASANVSVVPLTATLTPLFSNGNFTISIPGPTNPSLTVIIQANSNLVSTNWVNVYTGQPPINFVDPAPSGTVSRFYRAILLP